MLVSSIGYFDNRNITAKDYSVNSRITRFDIYGFGHVQNNNYQSEKNIFSNMVKSIKSLFSGEKSDKNKKSVSVLV